MDIFMFLFFLFFSDHDGLRVTLIVKGVLLGSRHPASSSFVTPTLATGSQALDTQPYEAFHSHGGTPKWMVYKGKSH